MATRSHSHTPSADTRHIFATELVNSGLPIHIGAALLGHLNVQTTRGYVAVFDEDIVRHYTAFLTARRAIRPTEEYHDVTQEEWDNSRSTSTSARSNSLLRTPLRHCLPARTRMLNRCPALHVNPKLLARLDEIETDLLARRARAEAEAWLGEMEGIDLTLTFLRAKRADTQRRAQRPAVDLGLPTILGRPRSSKPTQ